MNPRDKIPALEHHDTIHIKRSPTADTRTCDFANVKKEQLLESSLMHISDVGKGLALFMTMLMDAAQTHDQDKITGIDHFHQDFLTGFKQTGWWDNHRRITRHHLAQEDGIPQDVNLIDILEYIVDCTMAGKARSGEVTEIQVTEELLMKAFKNTCRLLDLAVNVRRD